MSASAGARTALRKRSAHEAELVRRNRERVAAGEARAEEAAQAARAAMHEIERELYAPRDGTPFVSHSNLFNEYRATLFRKSAGPATLALIEAAARIDMAMFAALNAPPIALGTEWWTKTRNLVALACTLCHMPAVHTDALRGVCVTLEDRETVRMNA